MKKLSLFLLIGGVLIAAILMICKHFNISMVGTVWTTSTVALALTIVYSVWDVQPKAQENTTQEEPRLSLRPQEMPNYPGLVAGVENLTQGVYSSTSLGRALMEASASQFYIVVLSAGLQFRVEADAVSFDHFTDRVFYSFRMGRNLAFTIPLDEIRIIYSEQLAKEVSLEPSDTPARRIRNSAPGASAANEAQSMRSEVVAYRP